MMMVMMMMMATTTTLVPADMYGRIAMRQAQL